MFGTNAALAANTVGAADVAGARAGAGAGAGEPNSLCSSLCLPFPTLPFFSHPSSSSLEFLSFSLIYISCVIYICMCICMYAYMFVCICIGDNSRSLNAGSSGRFCHRQRSISLRKINRPAGYTPCFQLPTSTNSSAAKTVDINYFKLACPTNKVAEFVKSVCRASFSIADVWGSRRNLSTFLSYVDR